MSVQEALAYYSNELSGFSCNTLKLQPSSKNSSIGAGDYTRIPLPSNSIINTRSFKLFFQCQLSGSTCARLPAGISSLIRRVEIVAGGQTLSQGTNLYSALINAKRAICGSRDNSASGNVEIIRDADEFSGAEVADTAAQPQASASPFVGTSESSFCIDDFSTTFLGSCEPYLLDMGILPDVSVHIYWEDDSILAASLENINPASLFADEGAGFTATAAAGATYTLNRLFATIECVSLADASYDQMLASQMSTAQFLEVPFKDYYCQNQGAVGGVARFDVATGSLDRVWVGYRYSGANVTTSAATGRQYNYSTQGPPVPVIGYAPSPQFLTRFGSTLEKYNAPSQVFRCPGADFSLQWTLNGSVLPQTPLYGSELMSWTKDQVENRYIRPDLTAGEYLTSSFVTCLRLCMPEAGVRLRSGLNTRSSNLQGTVRTTGGLPENYDIFTACEATSVLRIMPGRSCGVVP